MINRIIYRLITPRLIKKMDKNGGGIVDWTWCHLPWAHFTNGVSLTNQDYEDFRSLLVDGMIKESHEKECVNQIGCSGKITLHEYPIYKYSA